MNESRVKISSSVKGKGLKLFFNMLIPGVLMLLALFLSLIPLSSLVFSKEELFSDTAFKYSGAVVAFLSFSCVFCVFFSFMRKAYCDAQFYNILDPYGRSPESCYSFSYTAKYIECRLVIAIYKAGWAALFFFPSVLAFLITFYRLKTDGEMIKSIFIVNVITTFIILVTGFIFWYVVTGRYCLTGYLLYAYPLQSVAVITESSVLLTKGKLINLGMKRLLHLFLFPLRLFPCMKLRKMTVESGYALFPCEKFPERFIFL